MATTKTTTGSPSSARPKPAPSAPRLPQIAPRGAQLGEGGIGRWFREVRGELRKVVWPSREEVQNLTIVVIAVSVAVGTVLGGIDAAFERLFRLLLQQ